jgi:pSer/pThr/pTyr-binding forkhead associated (FHA) protein
VRLRAANLPLKALPKAISGFDGKTVRMRPIDLPVVGKVANTVRQRYADLRKIRHKPTKWDIARIGLVLLLASMPILATSVEVFGLAPQSTITMVTIALVAVLATLITFAPHRIDMIVGRGLIAGMVACIVYDGARLFAVHVLGLMGDFIPVMGSFVTGEPDTAGSAASRLRIPVHRRCRRTWCRVLRRRLRAGRRPLEELLRGAVRGGFRGLSHLGRADGNRRAGPAWRGADVPAERGHGRDHVGRASDLRPCPRSRLPDRTAWQGPQRMALATAVGISAGQAGHSVLEESQEFALGEGELRVVETPPTARGGTPVDLKTSAGSKLPGQEVYMSSHLEVSKPSGRELIPLSGQRVTLGKASTNVVSLEHDPTVSRLHAILENHGSAWSIRDVGSRNGTYVNGEKIDAERVLRSGDELRLGKCRLVYVEVRQVDEPADEATIVPDAAQLPPRLTRREFDVLVVLCRPLVSDDPFPEPASVRRMAGELFVTEAAVKQHLQNMYDKFSIPTEGDRRVRLANEALRRGAVTIAQLRDSGAT